VITAPVAVRSRPVDSSSIQTSSASKSSGRGGADGAGEITTASEHAAVKRVYAAIGVDCDPDRAAYPDRLTWRGVEALPRLFDLHDIKWTFNVRADTQIRDYCGSASYCYERFAKLWDAARGHGSAVGWHVHYFDRDGRQDTSERCIEENIELGAEALEFPDIVHMGWTFQSEFSVKCLARVGVRIDYSPLPRMRFGGNGGVDAYDWSSFAYRPSVWHGVRMIPAYTFRHALLRRRFSTERVMLTTTTSPLLYRSLLRDFLHTGADFFVSYFHADELVPALGDWRDRLYAFKNLSTNLERFRAMAARQGYEVVFVNVRELAEILFGERRSRHA